MQVKPSFGVNTADILKFCAETNPAVYFEQPAVEEVPAVTTDVTAIATSAPADCFQQSASISAASPVNSAELGAGSPLLTPKQRLQLCANAYNAMGPINCTLSALYKGSTKGNAGMNTGKPLIWSHWIA